MKSRNKITSTLLALLLSLSMIVTYLPASMIAYADDGVGNSAVELKDEAAPALRAAKTGTVLTFSSDVHNQSGNQAANRLGSWVDQVKNDYGGIDVMAFGGDMAGASASGYWNLAQADMTVLENKGVTGVYTTGNHECSAGGDFSYSSYTSGSYTNDPIRGKFQVSTKGAEGDDYIIYCLGSQSSSSSYSNSISNLTQFLNNTGNNKVIFIITHFPLHYYSSRSTTGAADVVDLLNNAVASGKKIVFLWGHNHTMSDTFYDYIYRPGDTIPVPDPNSSSSGGWWGGSSSTINKEIQFYYGAAGCMSDSEYGTGSASVKGKGLVVSINSKQQLSFTYYDANGNNVTEGGTYTEQDPVAVTGVTVTPASATVAARKSVQLTANVVPADATNKGVTWSSSNTSIATVSDTGMVKGVSEGRATITATTVDGGYKATSTVSVTPAQISADNTYTLTDTLEEDTEYLIANGNSGNVYIVSKDANGSRTLKGIEATVVDGTITLTDEEAEAAAFTAEIKSSQSGSVSAWLKIDGKYLYTNNANGLAVNTDQTNTDNTGKFWHYKADGKDLLWYFKDENNNDGYTDTSQTYKYYLSCSNGNFTDNHVSNTSLANTNTPKIYLFAKGSEPKPVTGVTLNKTSTTITVGRSETLTATVLPANAANKSVSWSSSNPSVATVDSNGTVTAVADGTATITVTTADGGKTATCTVTAVTEQTYSYVLTDKLEAGKEYLIANGNSGSVYLLSNEAGGSRQLNGVAATVSGDTITINEETAANTVFTTEMKTSQSGSVSAWLKIGGKYLYTNNANGLAVNNDQTNTDNTGKFWHYKADGKNLLWYFKDTSSSDGYTDTSQTYKYYLSCSNGVFTDNHVSNVSLGNTNTPAMYLYTKVTTPVDVTGVTLNKTSTTISKGKTETLTATVAPANATNKAVTWKSSNTSVATVTDGVVTAVSEGTANITVTTVDGGKTATCAVTVVAEKTKDYVLTDKLEAGKEYLIANGKSGSVYLVSNQANGSRTLKGVAATVTNNKITLTEDEAAITEFTSEANSNSTQNGFWLKNNGEYLYTDSNSGLRVDNTQTSSQQVAKSWHYKADNKNLLWFFKDTASSDGYTDTSQTYKYYLECSNGNFTDNHADYTSLANTNTPAIYLFTEDDSTPPHTHTYGNPTWAWTGSDDSGYTAATATFTCTANDDTQTVNATVTSSTSGNTTTYTATAIFNGSSYTDTKTVTVTPHSHTYGTPSWSWAADNKSATATFTCSECGETATVTDSAPVETVVTEASCTADEVVKYTAKVTFNGTEYTDTTAEITVEGTATGHSFGEWTVTTKPTCTEKGVETRTCSACQTTETRDVAALGHAYGAPVYTWADDYSTVTATIACANDAAHNITETVAATGEGTEATCEAAGEMTYTSAAFENEAFEVQTKKVTIPAKPHAFNVVNAKAATCTQDGNEAYYICSSCGKFFSYPDGKTELEDGSWIIPATGHNMTAYEAKEATCEEAGNSAYWSCSTCGKYFSDEEGTTAIKEGSWVIPATGHAWSEPTYIWSEGYSNVTGQVSCANNHKHDVTELVGTTSVTTEPTCEEAGETVYTSNAFKSDLLEVQTKTVEIPALGHSWSDWKVVTPATETSTGVEERTCSVCKKTETREIPVLGHEHDLTYVPAYVPAEDKACTEPGVREHWICDRGDNPCGKIFGDADGTIELNEEDLIVPVKDHTPGEAVVENEIAATCETAGSYEEVVRCVYCGEIISREVKTTEALGHDWGKWEVTTPATKEAAGVETRKCSRCDATETRPIDKLAPEPGSDPNQKGSDGTAVGPGASAAAAEAAITGMKSDTDPKGAAFGKLTMRSSKQTNTSITLKWTKVQGASKYVIYGHKCGKTNKPKKLYTVTGNSMTLKKVAGASIKKGTYYKFIVVALDKNNNVVTTSKLIHVATKGGKVGNHKSVTIKKAVLKKAKALKKGKSLSLKPTVVPQSKKLKVKKHVGIRYESSNKKIATVSSSGKITAKSKGTCYVYVFAQSGVFKKVKVVVK